jgi:hypothetical protein
MRHYFSLHTTRVPKLLDGHFGGARLTVLGAVTSGVYTGNISLEQLTDENAAISFYG